MRHELVGSQVSVGIEVPAPRTGLHEIAACTLNRIAVANGTLAGAIDRIRGAQPQQAGNSAKSPETPPIMAINEEIARELERLERQAGVLADLIG